MITKIEKMTDCEYQTVDKSSAPCHNPPVFIDRVGGHVVCIAHVESLEAFLTHQASLAEAVAMEASKAAALATITAQAAPWQG